MSSGLVRGELGGGFRVVLVAEWRVGIVVVWVRLGMEIGGGLLGVECSGVDGKEEEEGCGFSVERGGDFGCWTL